MIFQDPYGSLNPRMNLFEIVGEPLLVNGMGSRRHRARCPSGRAWSSPMNRFLSLLPLTLTLEDYASTEKIAYLSRRLTTQGAPAGIDPDVGDITYYAPWGNLAIFYRDFGYSSGLVNLGRIESGIDALSVTGPVDVTIEAVDN